MQLYKNNDVIYVNISTYSEVVNKTTGEVDYIVKGKPINITKPWLLVKARLSKQELHIIDLTEVFSFDFRSI